MKGELKKVRGVKEVGGEGGMVGGGVVGGGGEVEE